MSVDVKTVDGNGKKRLDNILKNLSGKVAKVGWLDRSKYLNGVTVATVAAIQEFGAPSKNIPPRSFMRSTKNKKGKEWKDKIREGAKAVADGSRNANDVMEAIGLKVAGDIRKTISEIESPPLKEATVKARMRRKSDKKTMGLLTKPLVDTGLMLGTLTNSVEDE